MDENDAVAFVKEAIDHYLDPDVYSDTAWGDLPGANFSLEIDGERFLVSVTPL